jgi:hypothetical protein
MAKTVASLHPCGDHRWEYCCVATAVPTLEELSQQYGILRERVRQVGMRAFERLLKAMKGQIPAARRSQFCPENLLAHRPGASPLRHTGWESNGGNMGVFC